MTGTFILSGPAVIGNAVWLYNFKKKTQRSCSKYCVRKRMETTISDRSDAQINMNVSQQKTDGTASFSIFNSCQPPLYSKLRNSVFIDDIQRSLPPLKLEYH